MSAQKVAQSVPVMSHKARRLLKAMTPAQKAAVREARWGETLGGYFLPGSTRIDVRWRLMDFGLLGKRSHVLTAAGQEVRQALRGER